MVRSRKLFALAAAGALVLAACGSDSDTTTGTDASTGTDAPAGTQAPADTEATTDTEAPSDTEASADTEAPAADGFAVDTSACEDPDAATAPIEGTIKIGTSIPLSGGPAVLFAPFGDGAQAYIDFYNAENGGVNGQELELIIKDDQYTADLTKANFDELVFDDEVALVGGIIGSANNLAIQADANAQCIPQLYGSTGAPNWGDVESNPWTTGLLVPYAIEAQVWAQWVAAEYGDGATVGMFTVNNEFGQAYVDAFTAAADENGLEIVAEETIDAADSGAPSGQMTNLVEAAPDAILAVPLGAQCIAFMTELGNAKAANPDFAPAVYQTATCANPIFFGAVANGGNEGVYTSANLKDVNNPELASDEAVAAYLEAFAATGTDASPGGIAVAGWLAMEMTVKALQDAADAGNLSREGVINAARNVDYTASLLRDGLNFKMGPDDGYIAEGTQLQQWTNGAFTDVGEVVDLEGTLGTFSE
jgi:branched-chain amino acid transport system substrate-binding protein